MPLNDDIFETLKLSWGICKPYDDIIAKVDYIEQTDAGLKVHCSKVEKEKKMNMGNFIRDIEKIVITKDGDNAVLCRGYGKNNMVVQSRSYCSPDDTFDFNIGAKLAFDRLYEGYDMTPKPKRKPYNGKIFVRHGGECYTLKNNHVYDVKNGIIRNKVGDAVSKFTSPYIFEGMSEDELSLAVDKFVFYGDGYYRAHSDELLLRHYNAYFVRGEETNE
jgi:hypothetical protein